MWSSALHSSVGGHPYNYPARVVYTRRRPSGHAAGRRRRAITPLADVGVRPSSGQRGLDLRAAPSGARAEIRDYVGAPCACHLSVTAGPSLCTAPAVSYLVRRVYEQPRREEIDMSEHQATVTRTDHHCQQRSRLDQIDRFEARHALDDGRGRDQHVARSSHSTNARHANPKVQDLFEERHSLPALVASRCLIERSGAAPCHPHSQVSAVRGVGTSGNMGLGGAPRR